MTTPDTPALAALREAENDAFWAIRPDLLDYAMEREMDRDGHADMVMQQVVATLHAYRDAVAARVRAELLAGAPTVWVATDGPDGNGWPGSVTLFVGAPRWEEEWRAWCPPSDGVGTTLSRHLAVELGVPPGTCVRYRIVPDPE